MKKLVNVKKKVNFPFSRNVKKSWHFFAGLSGAMIVECKLYEKKEQREHMVLPLFISEFNTTERNGRAAGSYIF